jgi:exodeoxyribonuclease V alpha subunit
MTDYDMEPVRTNGETPSIRDCIVYLTKSYRFGTESGIAASSAAVNQGDGDLALAILTQGTYEDIVWKDLGPRRDWPLPLKTSIIQGFRHLLRANDLRQAFDQLDHFIILCGLREGPYGVVALNAAIERMLRDEDLIRSDGNWYQGRPILITRNDYNLHLYNGDMGIVFPDPAARNELRVFFQGKDGILRRYHPLRLPQHETMYAVTVHKSQGSEFDHVLLILPDRDFPVLTRELIYTAITRARNSMVIWGDRGVFRNAVARRTIKASGLRDALMPTLPPRFP